MRDDPLDDDRVAKADMVEVYLALCRQNLADAVAGQHAPVRLFDPDNVELEMSIRRHPARPVEDVDTGEAL